MPGPQKSFKSNSQSKKKPKAARGGAGVVAASPSDSDEDVKAKPFMWRKKIRVICTDPDATDSSSEEDERISPKRLVREIFIPAHCSFSSSESEDDPPFFGRSHVLSQSSIKGSWMRKTVPRLPNTGCPKKGFNKKPPCLKKIRGLSHNRKSSQYTGVMQRRGGKWSAGIRDSKGIRLWLGTYNSPQAAAKAYDVAARCSKSRCSGYFDDVFPWDQPPYQAFPSNSSSVGMLDDGQELFPACSDLDSLMNSPSSVLENAVSDDSESPNFFVADKPSSDALSDEGPTDSVSSQEISVAESVLIDSHRFGHVSATTGSFQPLMPRVKLEVVNESTTMAPPSFLEETSYYGEFGQIFDFYSSGNSEVDRPHFLDPLDDEFFTNGEGFSDMSFDLDTEALAWINVPEVCGI